jgi:hypothetical protein
MWFVASKFYVIGCNGAIVLLVQVNQQVTSAKLNGVGTGLWTWEPLKPLVLMPFRFLVLSCHNPSRLIQLPVVLGVFHILKLPLLHLFLYVFMSYKFLLCSVIVLKWFSPFVDPPIVCVPSWRGVLYSPLENIGSTWPLFHTTEWKIGLCGNSCLKLVCF